jgi:hypothetical protein
MAGLSAKRQCGPSSFLMLFEGLSEAAKAAEMERPRSSAGRVPEKSIKKEEGPEPI